ncbi:hypothetical protein GCM10011322_29010 [Salinarimonas ramus]|uniref:Uncharacterized protein n=1 Tax=Salinarimonas ramus TaxID=690164 RepID=A0A917V5F2_9HYPH|nr:hypothetical protein GCM10011322_29010 [Salinarimonas ramus]
MVKAGPERVVFETGRMGTLLRVGGPVWRVSRKEMLKKTGLAAVRNGKSSKDAIGEIRAARRCVRGS